MAILVIYIVSLVFTHGVITDTPELNTLRHPKAYKTIIYIASPIVGAIGLYATIKHFYNKG